MIKLNIDVLEEYFTKKQLLKLGIISIILSLIFIMLSYVIIIKTKESVTYSKDTSDKSVSQEVCMSYLRGIRGLTVQSNKDDMISILSYGLEDPALKLGKASVASLICPGWELSSFCFGESCENGEGLEFDLKIVD